MSRLIRPHLLVVTSLLVTAPAIAADHQLGVHVGSLQIGEGLNNGLVFSGGQAALSYQLMLVRRDLVFRARLQLGGGAFTSRGMLGFGGSLRPVEAFLGFAVVDRGRERGRGWSLHLGPQLAVDYNLQLYPDLQTGQTFWSTCLCLGPEAVVTIPHRAHSVRIGAAWTLLGLTSRPPPRLDPYFYSLGFSDIVSKLHSDLEPASVHRLARGSIEVEYVLERGARDVALGYRFDVTWLYDAPSLVLMSHTLGVRFQL